MERIKHRISKSKRSCLFVGLLFFLIVMIIPMFFFTNSTNWYNSHVTIKRSNSLFSSSLNDSRVCSGEGSSFSCQTLFKTNYRSKSDIVDSAKYLYIKANPFLINIKTIRFDFTPSNVRENYTIDSILLENVKSTRNVSLLTNNKTNRTHSIGEGFELHGYETFSYSIDSINDPLQSLTLKGLTEGSLIITFLNDSNEEVALYKTLVEKNTPIEMNVKDARFIKPIGYGAILNRSFDNAGIVVKATRWVLNGKTGEEVDELIDVNGSSEEIALNSFGEWMIELEAIQGSFKDFTIYTNGLQNLQALVSTTPIRDLNDAFALNNNVKKSTNGTISFSLNTDYFFMQSLFKDDVFFDSQLDSFLSTVWSYLDEDLNISSPINASFHFEDLKGLITDVFSIPYTQLELTIDESIDDSLNVFTFLKQYSSTIEKLYLDGIRFNQLQELDFPELKDLAIKNANLMNLTFLNNSQMLSKLENLDLSSNNLGGYDRLFLDLANFSLQSLKLLNNQLLGNALINYLANNQKSQNLNNSLKDLDLSNNDYSVFPSFQNDFPNLESLSFKYNQLRVITSLSSWKSSLKILNLNSNKLDLNRLPHFSNELRNSLVVLDLGNNKDLKLEFIQSEASFSNLEELNLENISISQSTLDSFSYLVTPKLRSLNLGNNSFNSLIVFQLEKFLQNLNTIDLDISNSQLDDIGLDLLIGSITHNLRSLNIGNNPSLTLLPKSRNTTYSKLEYLNISYTNISSLDSIYPKTLVANGLKSFDLGTISLLEGNSYDFSNSSLVLSSLSSLQFDTFFKADNTLLLLTGVESYQTMSLKIRNIDTLVSSLQFQLLDEANRDRVEKELERKDALDEYIIVENLLEPYYYQLTKRYLIMENELDNDGKRTKEIKDETSYLLTHNTYDSSKIPQIRKTFKISFDNYGLFWSKNYLAAIVVVPTMLITFSLVNMFFAYHYKIKEKKDSKNKDGKDDK